MTIVTNFNIGEYAYFMHENRIKQATVKKIWTETEEKTKIKYSILGLDTCEIVYESDLYKTKKEAMHELIRQMGFDVSENDLKEI